LRSCMSSRVRDGFDGVFFEMDREGVAKLVRAATGLVKRGCEGAGVVATGFGGASALVGSAGTVIGVMYGADCADVLTSGGSEYGGSEPMFGLTGVRKGDLKGFFSVFVASFSLRRFACGVDILRCAAASGVICSQARREEAWWGERIC
jgi:hypothetical protein